MMQEMLAAGSGGGGGNVVTGTGSTPSAAGYDEITIDTGLSTITHFALVDDAGQINLTYANSKQSAVGSSAHIQGKAVNNTTDVSTMTIQSITNGTIVLKTGYYSGTDSTHGVNFTWYAD